MEAFQPVGLQTVEARLPFTPGRDFSGVVEAVGGGVSSLKRGDEVMGVVPAMDPGCHSEFALTQADCVTRKPTNLSFVQAAALPYVSCTAWSAFIFARLHALNAKDNRVLIHGGAGGVGSTAIQILKAWGARKIVATCSPDSFDLVSSLGACPVDYSSPQATEQLISEGPYEVIIDCVDSELSRWSDKILGVWRNCVHVSIISPMLNDTDRYGVPVGLATTAVKYFWRSFESALEGKWFTYAYFMPNKECLDTVAQFAVSENIRPIVQRVYSLDEAAKAYAEVSELVGRGKTIIDMEKK